MKKLKFSWLLLLSFVFPIITNAQKDNPTYKEIGIRLGVSLTSVKEQRFSALPKKYLQPKVGLLYGKWNDKKRQELTVSYSMNRNIKNPKFLWYKNIIPEVNYSYQRKVGNNWLGGYYESFTLLNLPKNGKGGFGYNPISYTVANSLGIAVDRSLHWNINEHSRYQLDMGLQTSLLSYVIRPHYAHPYPEHYLQEDIFNPTRKGMATSVIKSGKIRTLNKYLGLNLKLGINYWYKDNWKLGIQYRLSIQSNHHEKKMTYQAHDLNLGISYIY